MEGGDQARGHLYKSTTLTSPSICTFCHGFIFGIIKQGMKCSNCNNVVHHRCRDSVKINCCKMFPPPKNEHEFKPQTFYTPTYCDQCGAIIYGLYKQGVKCCASSCQIVAHRGCSSLVPFSCGTNPHVEPTILQKFTGLVVPLFAIGLCVVLYKIKK